MNFWSIEGTEWGSRDHGARGGWVINKVQPEAGLIKSGIKEILFKETHEQVDIGRNHAGVHDSSLNLKLMLGVKEKLVVGEDELD